MNTTEDICDRVVRAVEESEKWALERPEDWGHISTIVYDFYDRAAIVPKSRRDQVGTAAHIAHHDPATTIERNALDRLLVAEVRRLRGEVEDLREALARSPMFERR